MREIQGFPGIAPVILAAGDSSRMGYPKALLPLGGQTFLTAILRTIEESGLSRPTIVAGRDAERIRPPAEASRAFLLVNPHPERGQISSLQLALGSLGPQIQGCLAWPVDQPCVPPSLVRALLSLCLEKGAPLGMPVCGARRGHPVFFGRSLFPELLQVGPGSGAREIVMRHLDRAAMLSTDNSSVVEDIDTPEEYQRLTGMTLEDAIGGR
jgi:molybdenum cofactor cytidylyltransferase